ncbi:MAG: hypothetical protein RXS42_09355 [Nitrososphaeria archaeon]
MMALSELTDIVICESARFTKLRAVPAMRRIFWVSPDPALMSRMSNSPPLEVFAMDPLA